MAARLGLAVHLRRFLFPPSQLLVCFFLSVCSTFFSQKKSCAGSTKILSFTGKPCWSLTRSAPPLADGPGRPSHPDGITFEVFSPNISINFGARLASEKGMKINYLFPSSSTSTSCIHPVAGLAILNCGSTLAAVRSRDP